VEDAFIQHPQTVEDEVDPKQNGMSHYQKCWNIFSCRLCCKLQTFF